MRTTEVRSQKTEVRSQKLVVRSQKSGVRSPRRRRTSRYLVSCLLSFAFCLLPFAFPVSASDPGSGDWPMWGGTADRNMVSNMKGVPTSWNGEKKTNVKWVAALGSQSYGNTVVAGGQVYVGTNNEGLRDPKQGGDRGV